MTIKNKSVIVYDIEIFPNFFHCTCKNTENNKLYLFELSSRKNNIEDLVKFFTNDSIYFCGYNNHHYDDVIINYIIDYCNLLNQKLYTESTK